MKNIRIFIWKFSFFVSKIFNVFEQACFRNAISMSQVIWFIVLPMEQINKPVLNSPMLAYTCLSYIDSILGFIVPSLLSVIRLNNQDMSYFYVLKGNWYTFRGGNYV